MTIIQSAGPTSLSPVLDVGVAALIGETAHLRAQLESLPVIEQAKGILMVRYQIDPDAAFGLLRRWSTHTNVKLREIARLLVDAAVDPTGAAESDGPCGSSPRLELLVDQLQSGQLAGAGR
jgi:AmiR/NasT family two-component response regulator